MATPLRTARQLLPSNVALYQETFHPCSMWGNADMVGCCGCVVHGCTVLQFCKFIHDQLQCATSLTSMLFASLREPALLWAWDYVCGASGLAPSWSSVVLHPLQMVGIATDAVRGDSGAGTEPLEHASPQRRPMSRPSPRTLSGSLTPVAVAVDVGTGVDTVPATTVARSPCRAAAANA